MKRNIGREINLALKRVLLKAEPDAIDEHIDGLAVSLQEYWREETRRIFGAAVYWYEQQPEEKRSKAALLALLLLLFGKVAPNKDQQAGELSDEVKRRVSNGYILGAYNLDTYRDFLRRGISVVTPATRRLHDMVWWGMAGAYPVILQSKAEEAIGDRTTPNDIHSSLLSTLQDDDFQYWQGTAIQAVVRSRSFGAIDQLIADGVVYYKIVNPLDERTCPYCRGLANRVFLVSAAKSAISNFAEAQSLEEGKTAIPWIDTLDAVASTPFGIPPFHWLCRCRIVRV